MDEFFDVVGDEPASPYPRCKKPKCKKRIVPADLEMELCLTCPNCFEKYAATEEEISRYAEMIHNIPRRRNYRQKLKDSYGRDSEPWWVYENNRRV